MHKFSLFFSFVGKSQLQRHQTYHSETRSFKCNKCGKMYKSERNLKVHDLIHLEQRPHVCPHCDKSFLSSSKLKQHCNIHTGERPFKCNYCSKDFTNFPNWLKHTRRRHKVDHKTGDTLIKMPQFLCKKKKENTAISKSTTIKNTSTKISTLTSIKSKSTSTKLTSTKSTSTSTCAKSTSTSTINTITMPKISAITANTTLNAVDSMVTSYPFIKGITSCGDVIFDKDKIIKEEECKNNILTLTSIQSTSTFTKATTTCTKSTSTLTSNAVTMPKISTWIANTIDAVDTDVVDSNYDLYTLENQYLAGFLRKREDKFIITDPFCDNDIGALILLNTNSVDTLPTLDFQNNNEQQQKLNEEFACYEFELNCNNTHINSSDDIQNMKSESPINECPTSTPLIEFSLNNTQVGLPPINCLKRFFNWFPNKC